MLSRGFLLLIINGAILTGCAVFDYAWRSPVLIGLMLFLPLLDPIRTPVGTPSGVYSTVRLKAYLRILLFVTGFIIIILNPDYASIAVSTLAFAALPEEWFFRAYFMQRLKQLAADQQWTSKTKSGILSPGILANIMTSLLFSLLHTPTQGWFGLTTFFPSLLYGWVYQKTQDLILVVLLHSLSNIIFFIYIVDSP